MTFTADSDLLSEIRSLEEDIKEIAEDLGAEFYCFECDREFFAEHDARYCPYCGHDAEEEEFHCRNKLLGYIVPPLLERRLREKREGDDR